MQVTEEQIKSLLQLKQKDVHILAKEQEKAKAPAFFKKLDDKLLKITNLCERLKKNHENLELDQLKIEEAISRAKDGVKISKEKLEGIANDQQFKAVNREIDQLTKVINDKTRDLETATKNVSEAKEKLQAQEQVVSDEQEARKSNPPNIDALFVKLNGELETLAKERSTITVKVEKGILNSYEKILAKRNGVALVSAVGGSCHACNMKVRPQINNQLLNGEIEECGSCRRLLLNRD